MGNRNGAGTAHPRVLLNSQACRRLTMEKFSSTALHQVLGQGAFTWEAPVLALIQKHVQQAGNRGPAPLQP